MSASLNLKLAETLLGLVADCTPAAQPSGELLLALREAIQETTKAGNFEQLEAKVEELAKQVRSLRNDEALRHPKARVI